MSKTTARTPLLATPLVAGLLSLSALPAVAAPVAVDGGLGAEWSGITAVHVPLDPTQSTGPGNPGTASATVAYDVYLRSDANYVYGLLKANGDTGGLNFANLYFNTNLSGGSDWGMEVTNNRAFTPGVAGYYDLTGFLTVAQSAGNVDHVIEWAIDWSYFSADPQNVLPADTNTTAGIQFRTSQSFGYNGVTGDPTTRFGTVAQAANAVPEPGSLALLGLGLAGLVARRRRKA